MRTTYNRIAGQSVERLAALSDGVFAVAITLLVLDLKAPASAAIHSEQGLWLALSGLAPKLMMYVMTFMTLGIFRVGQQSQLNHLGRSVFCYDDAVLDYPVGGVYRLPDRAGDLLVEHSGARRNLVLELT